MIAGKKNSVAACSVPDLQTLLCAFYLPNSGKQAKEVTLQEMNSISLNYFCLIGVGVKYAQLHSVGQPGQAIIDYSFFPVCH